MLTLSPLAVFHSVFHRASTSSHEWCTLWRRTFRNIKWLLVIHNIGRTCLFIHSLPICLPLCVHAKSLHLCPALCDPMDRHLLGSSVHEILQARILEWVAFPLPGDLPDPGIEPVSRMSPALAGGFFTTGATWEAHIHPEKTIIQKDPCVPMFTAALFTTARTQKQPKCPLTDEWTKKNGTYIQWNITQP